jgi:uncharacterized protein (TIRG00374 family)
MRKILGSNYFRLGIGFLLSGITLYLALRGVSLWEVSRSVRQASPLIVFLGVVSVLVNILVKAVRWHRLTGDVGQKVGFSRILAAFLAGQLLNLIYPARAGDVSRILVIGQGGNDKAFILGSIILEKLADLFGYVFLTLLLLVQLPLPEWLNRSVFALTGLTILFLSGVVWLVSRPERSERLGRWLANRTVRWLPERAWLRIIQLVQITLTAIGVINRRRMAFELALWTGVVWLTSLLTNVILYYALNMERAGMGEVFQATLLVLIGLMAGIAVPSVPGRIGIFEYICVLALAVFGIKQTQALTYGILLHAVVFLPVLVLGVLALLRLSWKPSPHRQQVN